MKLAYGKYQMCLDLRENEPIVFVLENPHVFAEFLQDFQNQISGSEESFALSEGEKEYKLSKVVDYVMDPFSLDFNKKAILNKLYAKMNVLGDEMVQEKAEVNASMLRILETILEELPYQNVEYQYDFAWQELFKLYGVKINCEYESLIEKLTEYIKISSTLAGFGVLLLVNVKNYLTKEEIKELYQQAAYSKTKLLLVEGQEREKLEGEKITIIDKDLCVIVK